MSNVTTVDAEGQPLSLTILDEAHTSNTRLEARISRCGPDGLGLQTAYDRTAESTHSK